MRSQMLLAGLAAIAVLPAHALAQETCQQRAENRVAGTALGAVAGALLGSAVAGRGHHTTGAVVGGLAGGVVGNQLAKGPEDCAHAYGWYDNDGNWHATSVSAAVATGYYDQNGAWVSGPPPGYQYSQSPGYGDNSYYRGGEYQRGGDYQRGGAYQRGGGYQRGGDYGRGGWGGYPEFRDRERRIGQLIVSGVGAGSIDPGYGRQLMHRLGDVRVEEAREYRNHGPNLPENDRDRIASELQQLDGSVDQARENQ